MIDPNHVPAVTHDESLARFVFHGSHIRQPIKTVKPDAFMPPPNLELSVTRHLEATEAEIWNVGRDIAIKRELHLYGRTDIGVSHCAGEGLRVEKAPILENPNHAHILGWPADKAAQKSIAQQLAAVSSGLISPPPEIQSVQ